MWNYYAAGTPHLTPDGHKSIEQFRIGDQILSRAEGDPAAPLTVRYVEKLFELSDVILELRVGGRVIRTTAEHPFFVLGKGWTKTAELQVGDLLVTHHREPVAVEDVRRLASFCRGGLG